MRAVACLLVAGVLLVGLTNPSPADVGSSGASRVHRDEERGFSIALPEARGGWRSVATSEADIALSLEGPDVSVEVGYQRTPHSLEVDFLGIISRDLARENETGYREIEARMAHGQAPPFYVLEYESRVEGKVLHVLKRIYANGQRVISISVVGPAATWARNQRIVSKILSSFAFLETEAASGTP